MLSAVPYLQKHTPVFVKTVETKKVYEWKIGSNKFKKKYWVRIRDFTSTKHIIRWERLMNTHKFNLIFKYTDSIEMFIWIKKNLKWWINIVLLLLLLTISLWSLDSGRILSNLHIYVHSHIRSPEIRVTCKMAYVNMTMKTNTVYINSSLILVISTVSSNET